MGSYPLRRTILVVVRVPLAVSFDDDVLYCVWCRVQNAIEVPVWWLTYVGNKRESVDLPINYQLFGFQYLLADRAEPRRSLLHHAVPRSGVEALRVDAFFRPGREFDPGVAQLDVPTG